MDEAVRRLKPDPENWPGWLREELGALAARYAHLPPEEARRAAEAQLSSRARACLAEQARRARIAHRMLREAHRAL
jgi:hypothetical protein